MDRSVAIAAICVCVASTQMARGQSPSDQTQLNPSANATVQANASNAPTLYRDPRTGELYEQVVQTIDQPVTQWQRKVVERTVVTPQQVIENVQVPQTYYVARTEYVLDSKLKGWWNPFRDPTYAYEYVPVTRWVPQTQMVTRQVPATKMIARTEQVPVDEPVQTTQKVNQVTYRKLPPTAAPSAVASAPPVNMSAPVSPRNYAYQPPATTAYANRTFSNPNPAAWNAQAQYQLVQQTPPVAPYGRSNSQPLVASVPVLSQQRPLAWQPGTLIEKPMSGLRNIVRSATAPLNGQATYAAPMNIASVPSTGWHRDPNQSGMPATVLR